ncbi:phage tail protein [Actinophytocola sp.]|uniref:phage tail protein n=1 Tax=Actinophytocola sp. TaxID=1872138 RepID=UPI003D6A8008
MSTRTERIAALVPRAMWDDDLLMRLVAVFDELLDGVATPVEDLDVLAHPALAPDAMVDWLCAWLGWEVPPGWPSPEAKRRLLRSAGELLTHRGTARGIRRLVEVLGGADVSSVEIVDPGFAVLAWTPPAEMSRRIEVDVHGTLVEAWSAEDRTVLERLIRGDLLAGCPVSVRFREPSTSPPAAQ